MDSQNNLVSLQTILLIVNSGALRSRRRDGKHDDFPRVYSFELLIARQYVGEYLESDVGRRNSERIKHITPTDLRAKVYLISFHLFLPGERVSSVIMLDIEINCLSTVEIHYCF